MQFLNNRSIWAESHSHFNDKESILNFFAHKFSKTVKCYPERLFEGLLAREALQTTAQKKGIALPHCLIDKIDGVYAGFLRLDSPIYFDAQKENQCDLFICIISAKDAGAEYLKFLAKVSRFMRDADTQTALRKANATSDIIKILSPITE
jgi:PTS system nitrogen regulatory IIA component